MTDKHGAGNCLWATPTLFLQAPLWLESTDRPWSCVRGATPSILDTTEICAACPRWEPQVHSPRVCGPISTERTTPTLLGVRVTGASSSGTGCD